MQEISTRSPGLNAVTAGADLVDDADALVAENAARLAGRHVAFEDVQVGAANRRLGDLDDRVGRRRDFRLWRDLPGPSCPGPDRRGFHCPGCCGNTRGRLASTLGS